MNTIASTFGDKGYSFSLKCIFFPSSTTASCLISGSKQKKKGWTFGDALLKSHGYIFINKHQTYSLGIIWHTGYIHHYAFLSAEINDFNL